VKRTLKPAIREEQGQILVIFALSLTALIAMVGLVLDGSGAFAQRRIEQNSADLAALAGADAYMNVPGNVAAKTAAATAAARASATRNGYTAGVDGTALSVDVTLGSSGATIKVGLTDPHTNNFARIVPGQASWDVSVTAAAEAGSIDSAVGAAPWIMDIHAFNNGHPLYGAANPQVFGEVNGDYPVDALDLAWTDFNGNNNVNTSEVSNIIDGSNVVTATMGFDQYIGQHNQGNHTALYPQVDQVLAGQTLPVPIVGDCPNGIPSAGGCFKGWAFFYVISAGGGGQKTITGYFIDDFKKKPLSVGVCTPTLQAAGTCGVIADATQFDNLVVRLTD
jgi:hypothetical protein